MAADALVTTLGFDAQQAIATLKAMELQLNSYTSAMTRAASATSNYNKLSAGAEKSYQSNVKGAKTVTEATKKQSTAVQSAEKQLKKASSTMQRLGNQSKKTSGQMVLSWQSVIRIFAIQVIHQAISKVTSALGSAGGKAADLEISLAEIQTIGGPLKNDFEGLSGEVRELSDAFGIQSSIVAEGIYQTLSNQVGAARQSFTFFAAAADFAVASVTSADASINLLSSTVNAFGFNASQATLIGAKLFKTIELGRIRGEEFANTFGRVAVLASRLGVSLDEVLASIATLTISGLRYNEAFTLITNVMLKLIRPTEAMKDVFAEIGISTVEAGIQAFGFQGLLAKLADTAGSTATELGKLFGRVRAVRGALGLTGPATEKYVKNLKAIKEAGPEDLFEAKKLLFKTNAKQVQLEIQELRNVIVFDFGRKALQTINQVIDAFGGLTKMTFALGAGLGTVGAGFLAMAALSHPVITGIIGIGLAVTALTVVWNELSKTGQERIEERLNAQKKAVIEINAVEAKAAESRINIFKVEFSALQRILVGRLAAINEVKQVGIMTEEILSSHLNQQLDNRKVAFDRFVKSIIKNMDKAKDNIKNAQRTIFALQQKLGKEVFEGQTKGFDEARKAQAILQRSTELTRQGAQEFTKGHKDRGQLLFGEATAMAEQAKAIGESIGNASLERRARETVKNIIEEEIRLQQQLVNTEKQRGTALSKQLPGEQARGRRIGAIIEEIKEFSLFTKKGIISFGTEAEAIQAVLPLLTALQEEFEGAGSKINIFKRLEETGENDLQKALEKVLKPLDAVFSARKIDLKFAYQDRIRTIFKDIQDVANEIPIDVKLRLEKLGFDPSTLKGIEDASKGLVEVFQSIERSVRATAGLKGQQKSLEGQIEGVNEAVNNVTSSFSSQLGVVGTFTEALKRPGELLQRVLSLDISVNDSINDSNRLLGDQAGAYNQIFSAASRAKETITGTFDPEIFTSAMTSLEGAAAAQDKLGNKDVANNIRFLIKQLKEAGETAQGIDLTARGTEIQFGAGEIQKLEVILTRQSELGTAAVTSFENIGVAAITSATEGNTAFSSMQTALKTLQGQANDTARAIGNIASGAAVPARLGRMIYRQYGGYTPQSTDTIPAMLTRGEFVVNAKSAQKFHSQLIAMNAGNTPTFRRTGGTTTTIGDVNVTVNGSPVPEQTARAIIRATRREQRRHTS